MTKVSMDARHAGLAAEGWRAVQATSVKGDEEMKVNGWTGFGELRPPTALGPRFGLGRLAISPRARAIATDGVIRSLLARHVSGDWGSVTGDQAFLNEKGASDGSERVRSAYKLDTGGAVVIVTDHGHVGTMVVTPPEESFRQWA